MVFSKYPLTNEDIYPYKKISSITKNGDNYTVVTEDAPLTAVFKSLDIQFTQEVTTGDVDSGNLAPGITLNRKAPFLDEKSVSFNLDKELYNKDGVIVKALGQIDMKLKFTFILSIEEGKVYGFGTSIIASQTSDIGFNVNGSWDSSKIVEIGKILNKKMKFIVTIPGTLIPIPVWIDVEIPFYVGIEANVTADTTTKFTRTDNGTMGLLYNRVSNNWTPISVYNKTQEFTPPTLSGAVSIMGYTGPELITKIYDIAGPKVSFFGKLNFDAEANIDKTVMPLGYEWNFQAGLVSNAEIDFTGLKKILPIDGIPDEVDENLFDTSWSLGNGPELKSIALDPVNARVEKTKPYNFEDKVKIIGTFDGSTAEISYTDADLTITNTGSGTIAGNIYTAPNAVSTNTEKLTFTYKYNNKYTSTEVTKTAELPIEVYEPKTLNNLTVNPNTASVVKNGNINLSNFTVTASYTDNTSAVVTNVSWFAFSGGGSISGTTYTAPATAGSATIRVMYEENENPYHADIAVTVTETPDPGGDTGGTSGGSLTVLQNNVKSLKFSGSAGTYFDFKLTVPAGYTYLYLGTANDSGEEGKIKTYIKHGSQATSSNFDYSYDLASEFGDGNVFNPATPGDWYIRMEGTTSFSNFYAVGVYANQPIED
ncbi:MAG: hypothetical protein M0R46_08530 [Candidatus Muirbacterium halophilum]|nr:hypothetical protein [Candidatus Muirbacterium halophilum]MCK9475950.1 hypothetical protein [Candidatus Muirbacterium halophilum]